MLFFTKKNLENDMDDKRTLLASVRQTGQQLGSLLERQSANRLRVKVSSLVDRFENIGEFTRTRLRDLDHVIRQNSQVSRVLTFI